MRSQLFRFLFFISFLLMACRLHSQDVHFSQYYLSPLTLNPALTGAFGGDWRISANYRTQWRAIDIPFTTFSLGYDRNFFNVTNRVSGGLLFLHDQSGNAKINFDKIYLSGALHPKTNGSNFHLGLQAGLVMKSFDIRDLTFPDQYDPSNGLFNGSLPNNEFNFNEKKNYLDINIGLAWDKRYNKVEPKIGFAVYHINRPNESFFGSKFRVPVRKVFHAALAWQASEKFSVVPKVLFMEQVKASEITYGSNFGYGLGSNKLNAESIYIGVQSRTGVKRNTDSFMGIIGMTFERMDVGISYDVNVSSLKAATNKRGGIEFAIIFWSGTNELKPNTIPCDRF